MTKRYLITSALPYINGVKHLGNLVGSMLPADVYARFLRQQGEEVLFICGTDEHGTPAELAAVAAKKSIEDYCRQMYELQKSIYEQFELSFDYFGRSSDPLNSAITQHIFTQLDENGYIEEKEIEQVYSPADGRFLPDRYVVGTCPKCGYENAKGDQCESCSRLLDPTELINPRSAISGSKDLEIRQSKHLYLKLAELQPIVATWLESRQDWSPLSMGISKKWLTEGLSDRCITRDVTWGIKIPKANYEDKRFYVWFDAPMAYISITQEWAKAQGKPDAWRNWWFESDDVRYVQFMAKDNVVFHSIFWPAMLLGAKENWKQVDYIKSFNWLNYENSKFSTSSGRGVFTDTALTLFPADYWRYYLLAIAPESSDSNFTFTHFAETINSDLANNLGNFVNRILTLIQKYFPDGYELSQADLQTLAPQLHAKANDFIEKIAAHLSDLRFTQVIQELKAFWSFGNEYITASEPWKVAKSDLKSAGVMLGFCYVLVTQYAVVSAPIVPNLSGKLFAMLGHKKRPADYSFKDAQAFLKMAHDIRLPAEKLVLVHKILPETVASLTEQFAGK